ncbi:MAG: hypothetical protein A3I69_07305 [Deltaproteobacteria bacterium RIFCSPLOWO2_02_FULL_40_36]|nr:MAG: hypothetical protein A3I69_07305 [Deltaproteobacteria bacterium RIFCSPLOWO2_02_FULL_40_36]
MGMDDNTSINERSCMNSLGRIQKGCASIKGTSRIRHLASLGGELAHEANRLYMLTVKRESLTNKKRSLENRLKEINRVLKEIEAETDVSNKKYMRLSGKTTPRQSRLKSGNRGSSLKAFSMKY